LASSGEKASQTKYVCQVPIKGSISELTFASKGTPIGADINLKEEG